MMSGPTKYKVCSAGAALALWAVVLMLPAVTRAQQPPQSTDEISEAMGAGDVKTLLGAMSQRVAIAVFGASREYSRTQAEYVLKDFFAEYPAAGFEVSRFSETESGAFMAGRYQSTRRERDIDVYLRLRDRDGNWEVREIIIRTEPR